MIRQIGKYEILSELGRGAFGRVFRARDPLMGREVAVKVLIADSDKSLLERFRSEAESAGKLRHENIVTVYEYGDDHNVPYIAMELLDKTVQQIIEDRDPLSLLDKLVILTDAARGLACAHNNGIVHRDVKPGNIMLARDRSVKVTDFGIARITGSADTRKTQQGQIIGSLPYLSPERLHGADADTLADIFAWGVIAYELLAGEHPFPGDDPGTVMYRITSVDPPPLRKRAPACPHGLDFIIQRAMAKDRELRYSTFEDIVFDLHPILQEVRQQEASVLMEEVERLVAAGDIEAAQAKIRQVLELDPANAGAREIRRRLLEEANRQHMRARVDGLLQEGTDQLRQRHFNEAIQRFESAQRLDPGDAQVEKALAEAKALREASRRASAMVSEARRELQHGNLTEAFEQITGALEADAGNPEALLLRDNIGQQIESRNRQRRLHAALQRAEELRAGGEFDAALAVLAEVEAEQPGSLLIAGVRTQIEHEQSEAERRRRAEDHHAVMNDIHAAMRAGRISDARSLLEQAERRFPGDTAITDLLADVTAQIESRKRAETLRSLNADAFRLVQEQRFAEARRVLEQGLLSFPGDPGLEHLLQRTLSLEAAHNRAQTVARVLEEARQMRDGGDIDRALQHIATAGAELANDPALMECRGQMELQREQQRYTQGVSQTLERCRALIAQDSLTEAVSELEKATADYPAESELSSLLLVARRAKAAKEEQAWVESVLSDVEALEKQGDVAAAFSRADEALRRYPYNAQLSQTLRRVREAVRHHERRERTAHHLGLIESALSAGDWKAAAGALQVALHECPGDHAFAGVDERIERARFEAELQAMAAHVRSLVERNDIAGAMRRLNETQARFRQEPLWQSLQAEVRQRLDYQEAIAEARDHLASGDTDRAERSVRQVIAHAFDDSASNLLKQIQEQRSRKQAEAEVAAAERESDLLLQREDWAGVTALWRRVAEAHPGNAQVETLRRAALARAREAEQQQSERQRAAEVIDQTLEFVRAREQQRDWTGALSRVEAARESYPDHPVLNAAADRLRRIIQDQQRRENLGDYLRRIDAAVSGCRWEEAFDTLNSAAKEFPEEEVVRKRQAQAMDAHRTHRLSTLSSRIRKFLDAGKLDDAAVELQSVENDLGSDPVWKRLHSEVQRRRSYEAVLAEAGRLLDGSPGAEAIASAEKMLLQQVRSDPPDARGARLLERCAELSLRAEREQEIQDGLSESAALAEKGETKASLALLERLWEKYPDDVAVTDARNAAAERQWVDQLMLRTEDLRSNGDLQAALALVESGLLRYPKSTTLCSAASAFRDSVRSVQRSEAVAEIRGSIAAGKLEDAARLMEAACNSWPEEQSWPELKAELAKRRDEIQQALKARTENELVNQALSRAADLRKRQQTQAALDELNSALERYPDNRPLREASERLRHTLADEERRRRVAGHVERVEEALLHRRWTEAESCLAAARGEFPGEKIFDELDRAIAAARRQETEARQREQSRLQAYENGLSEAGRMRDRGDFQAAEEILRNLTGDNPPDTRAATLLNAVISDRIAAERAGELSKALAAASSVADTGDLRSALTALDRLRQDYPDEPVVVRQCQAVRMQLYESELNAASALAREGSWERAEDLINPVLAGAPDNRASSLLEEVRAGRRRHNRDRAIARGIAECEGMLREGRTDSALAALQELCNNFPDVPELKTRREAIEQKRLIETALAEIGQMERQGDCETALKTAEEAAARHSTAELVSAVERLRAEVRKRRLAAWIQATERCLSDWLLDQAEASIKAGRHEFPEEKIWDRLSRDLERRRGYEALLHQAESLRARQEFSAAEEALVRLEHEPPDSRAAILLAAVRGERTRRQREQTISAARARAEALAHDGKLTEALASVEEALAQYPGEDALVRERRTLQTKLETEFVNQALHHAADLQNTSAPAALAEIQSALLRYPDNRELQAAAGRLEDFIRQEDKRRRLAEAIISIEALLSARDWARAASEIATAKSHFPAEKVLVELERTLQQSRHEHELEQFVCRIRELLAEDKLAEAQSELAGKKSAFGREEAWRDAEREIDRYRRYRNSLDKASHLRQKGDLAGADALLRQIIPSAPDTRAVMLLQKISEERIQQQQAATVRSGQEQAAKLAAEGKMAEALAAVDALRAQYPDDAGLMQLRQQLEAKLAAEKKAHSRQPPAAPRSDISIPPPLPEDVSTKGGRRRFAVGAASVAGVLALSGGAWFGIAGRKQSVPERSPLKSSVTELSFVHEAGKPNPEVQQVRFEGASDAFTVVPADGWLMAKPLAGARLDRIEVAVNAAGLPAGTYRSVLTIQAGSSTLKLPVNVRIDTPVPVPGPAAQPARLRLTPQTFTFSYVIGEPVPAPQELRLLEGQIRSISTSASWLRAVRNRTRMEIQVNPEGVSAGEQHGLVTAVSYDGQTQAVPVHLSVRQPAAPPVSVPQLARNEISPKDWGGSTRGRIIWTGDLNSGAEVILNQDRVFHGGGAISGMYPGIGKALNVTVVDPPGVTVQMDAQYMRIRNAGSSPAKRVVIEWYFLR